MPCFGGKQLRREFFFLPLKKLTQKRGVWSGQIWRVKAIKRGGKFIHGCSVNESFAATNSLSTL